MGQLIKFPTNNRMLDYEIEEQYREYYADEEGLYFLNPDQNK